MKLSYNLTGAQRKTLVDAIGQELNTSAEYLGVPTFAYEVGGYHIDKNGTVTGNDKLDLEDALHQKGFEAVEREYDEPDTYESSLGGMGALPSVEELCGEKEPDKLTIEMPLEGFKDEAIAKDLTSHGKQQHRLRERKSPCRCSLRTPNSMLATSPKKARRQSVDPLVCSRQRSGRLQRVLAMPMRT